MSDDDESGASDGLGPFYLETHRDKRLERWAKLKAWFINESGDYKDGVCEQYPFVTLEPWYELPDPPWPRAERGFTVPFSEIFYNTELNYEALVYLITHRAAFCYHTANTTDGQKVKTHPELLRLSKLWIKGHAGLDEALKTETIPGLGPTLEKEGLRFLVFRTARIEKDVLECFFDSADQLDPRDETFHAFAPFYYLLADGGPLNLETYDGSPTKTEDLGHFPPSRCIGQDSADVGQTWQDMVRPVMDRRSMYATRCCVILDDKTAEDGTTAQVLVALHDQYVLARTSFGLLKRGILKAYEMCFLDPDMLALDENNVLTEDKYGEYAG